MDNTSPRKKDWTEDSDSDDDPEEMRRQFGVTKSPVKQETDDGESFSCIYGEGCHIATLYAKGGLCPLRSQGLAKTRQTWMPSISSLFSLNVVYSIFPFLSCLTHSRQRDADFFLCWGFRTFQTNDLERRSTGRFASIEDWRSFHGFSSYVFNTFHLVLTSSSIVTTISALIQSFST